MNELSSERLTSVESGDIKRENIWGDVTDPQIHNPIKYRYLVHGINPIARATMPSVKSEKPTDINDGDQKINLLDYPERLSERVSLSCSLIDQDHIGTWGDAGLIVESPIKNVIMTSYASEDLGSITDNRQALLEQARSKKLLSPEALLNLSHPNSYNEVSVLAENDGEKVRLAGFFIKATSKGTPINEYLADIYKKHAKRLGFPLVDIRVPSQDEIIRNGDEVVAVSVGDKYYPLKGTGKFQSYEQDGILSFTSPSEMEYVFEYLKQQGINDEEINRIKTEYENTDRQRQTAKARFSKDGKVIGIEKRRGYGKQEEILRINDGGYAYASNAYNESKAMIKAFSSLGSGTEQIQKNYYNGSESKYVPINIYVVRRMVEEALQNSDSEQRGAIEEFAKNSRTVY